MGSGAHADIRGRRPLPRRRRAAKTAGNVSTCGPCRLTGTARSLLVPLVWADPGREPGRARGVRARGLRVRGRSDRRQVPVDRLRGRRPGDHHGAVRQENPITVDATARFGGPFAFRCQRSSLVLSAGAYQQAFTGRRTSQGRRVSSASGSCAHRRSGATTLRATDAANPGARSRTPLPIRRSCSCR